MMSQSSSSSEFLPEFYKIAVISFQRNLFIEAAYILSFCYNKDYNRDEIFQFLMQNFYKPFEEHNKKNYILNTESFNNYKHIYKKEFPDFNDLNSQFVPINISNIKNQNYIKYNKLKDKFEPFSLIAINFDYNKKNAENISGNRILLYNVYDTNLIKWICENAQCKISFALKTPNYMYYDSFEEFIGLLQIIDFTDCLNFKKSVFLFGPQELETFLLQPEVLPSDSMIFNADQTQNAQNLNLILQSIIDKKELFYNNALTELNDYYSKLTPAIIKEKILNKTARIVLAVSKCTTAIQYYIRDCSEAFTRIGYNPVIMTETDELSPINGSNKYDMVNYLLNNKPDILFIMDHFRWEWPYMPENFIFICWIMDHLPHLFDKNSPAKLTDTDFILSLYYDHPSFTKIGYPIKQVIRGPIPANPYIYKKYELTEQEYEKYACDICIISNSGNAMDVLINHTFAGYNDNPDIEFVKKIKTIYMEIYDTIFDAIYNEKKHYYHDETFKLFKHHFMDRTQFVSEPKIIDKLVFDFWGNVIMCIYKDTTILWLHEKGYNMKLWGKAWINHPVLKKYSAGIASNGETMSKILNASKISIGLAPNITLHPRVAESLLSECMYIGNDIPSGEDWCSIRKFLSPGKEITLFKNKKDLYKKIDYYLENKREREAMTATGRKKVIETLTYEIIMKNTLDGIVKRLSEIN